MWWCDVIYPTSYLLYCRKHLQAKKKKTLKHICGVEDRKDKDDGGTLDEMGQTLCGSGCVLKAAEDRREAGRDLPHVWDWTWRQAGHGH